MNDVKKRHNLRLILAEAHRRKESAPPQPDQAWRRSLMSRIRALEVSAPRFDPRLEQWRFMERLVWRLAPAAGALALLLAILVGLTGADPAVEVAGVISADTADSGLYTFYQSESGNE